jgi:hypothetical protein
MRLDQAGVKGQLKKDVMVMPDLTAALGWA